MSKSKDQGNCSTKQKQATKKNLLGKGIIACIKKKKKSFARKEANMYKEMKKKKKNLESRRRKLKIEHGPQ